MKDVRIYIHTEYSGTFSRGTGKYHVILETNVNTSKGEEIATLKDYAVLENVTRNKIELLAIKVGLSHLKKASRVTIYTNSEYVIGAFNQGWPMKWAANEFRRKGKEIKHADLWKDIIELSSEHSIEFIHSEKTEYTRVQQSELKNL